MMLFFLQLRHELAKLFARGRTHLGFAVFLGAEALIFSLMHTHGAKAWIQRASEQNGYLFTDLYTGPTLAYVMVSQTVFLLGGLFLALISGDLVAKEVEDGTLRMILCRPISRLRILALKYITCVVYTFTLCFFIVASSLLMGILFQGTGDLFVYSPMEGIFSVFSFTEGLGRFFLATLCLGVATLTFSTLGFTLSCLNMKPATATIATLSLLFVDSIVHLIPYFKSIQPYCLSTNMEQWIHVFEGNIPWEQILSAFLFLGAVDGTLLTGAVVIFSLRDFKS